MDEKGYSKHYENEITRLRARIAELQAWREEDAETIANMAHEIVDLREELAEARGLLREHLEIIEEDLDKGRYAVPGLLKARADRIRAAIDKAGGE